MTKQVSLKDIAEGVGVSSATVSLVLNGKAKGGRVGEELSKRICNTAKQLNYKPLSGRVIYSFESVNHATV